MIERPIQNSRGTILVVAMLLMTTLTIIGIATNTNVLTDTGIASNYLSSLQSFYAAEAGLERGKMECAERFSKGGWSDFNSILRGPDDGINTGDDGILSFGSNVSFHGGRYSVRVINEAGDSGGAAIDTNATVTLISRGFYGNSATTLSTTIAMNLLPPFPGSVSLVGRASTHFGNDNFLIDGRDHSVSGVLNGAVGPQLGISINDIASASLAKNEITKSLTSEQTGNIIGAEANPSVGISTVLTKNLLRQFVDILKKVADNKIFNPPDALSTSGPGNVVTIGGQTYSLGTMSAPQMTYISKPGSGSISLNGSGFGIMIVEGNNLCFKPNMSFTGVLILLGNNIVLNDSGDPAGLQLFGGLIVADVGEGSSGYNLILTGGSKIRYSREAIDQAKSYLVKNKKFSVLSWQRSY